MQRNPLNRPSSSCYHFSQFRFDVSLHLPHEARATPVFLTSSTPGTERPTSYTCGRRLRPLTSRGPSVGACLGSKEPVQSVTSRSRSSHVSAFPFHTGRCWLGKTHPERPAPLPMLIVGQRGRVDESMDRVLHTAVEDPDELQQARCQRDNRMNDHHAKGTILFRP